MPETGATIRANTVVDLSDGSTLNFLYRVDGLLSFDQEIQRRPENALLGTKCCAPAGADLSK